MDRQNSPLLVPRLKSIYNLKSSSIRIITIHIYHIQTMNIEAYTKASFPVSKYLSNKRKFTAV